MLQTQTIKLIFNKPLMWHTSHQLQKKKKKPSASLPPCLFGLKPQICFLLPLPPPHHTTTHATATQVTGFFAKAVGAAVSMVSPSQGLCLRDMIVLNEWLCLMALLEMEGENTFLCCSHSIILPL